jgi:hypothetical protein
MSDAGKAIHIADIKKMAEYSTSKEAKEKMKEVEKDIAKFKEELKSASGDKKEELEKEIMNGTQSLVGNSLAPKFPAMLEKVKTEDFAEFYENWDVITNRGFRLVYKDSPNTARVDFVDLVTRVCSADDPAVAGKDLAEAFQTEDKAERKKKLDAFKSKYSGGGGMNPIVKWILIILGILLFLFLIGFIICALKDDEDEDSSDDSSSSDSSDDSK